MKIKTDRTLSLEGDLVFTVTVSEPHLAPFSVDEITALISIDVFTQGLAEKVGSESRLFRDLLTANHEVKQKIFDRLLMNLKFSIENEFQPKFQHICQEIYNWITDNQKDYLKKWMLEFNPQRTTYYFDNDENLKNQFGSSAYGIPDDKVDEDDEDEDDDE